jgi:hypothetical protein
MLSVTNMLFISSVDMFNVIVMNVIFTECRGTFTISWFIVLTLGLFNFNARAVPRCHPQGKTRPMEPQKLKTGNTN